MTDASLGPTAHNQLRSATDVAAIPDVLDSTYARAALTQHKREGLELAVKARWITMGVTAVYLLVIMPHWEVLYYLALLALLCLNGYFIRAVGRVGHSRLELLLIFLDLSVLTFGMVVPNPFTTYDLPVAFMYRFDNFQYFFVILAVGTMAYSWRTVIAIGTWTTGLWLLGLGLAWWFSTPVEELSAAMAQAFPDHVRLQELLDPNGFLLSLRVQEVMVFLLVAFTLGISIRRFDRLLLSNAGLERERANLSRYFSPNVVEQLSQNDEPLKQVKMHDVAILFVDIVGFTTLSAKMEPYAVITLLREFHGRMEHEVFRQNGTLDKYLGDGLMATFGTPFVGPQDGTDALACAVAMQHTMDRWNLERKRRGEPEIQIGIGVHYGETLLGDIGANRLEFAVIGTSVNVASRLEQLTRTLQVRTILSDALYQRIKIENVDTGLLDTFVRKDNQAIRGVSEPISVWCA